MGNISEAGEKNMRLESSLRNMKHMKLTSNKYYDELEESFMEMTKNKRDVEKQLCSLKNVIEEYNRRDGYIE